MLTPIILVSGLIVLIFAALTLSMAWAGTRQLIYPARRHATTTPADYGLSFEAISFNARDGFKLRGWFIPAPNPQGTIVLCHGYAGECSPDLKYAPLLYHARFNTLFFDFRGHGMSDGNYTSLVSFERDDLLAALDYLRARDIARVGLFGLSMGGAIALATAPLSPMVVGVVSDCAFSALWRIVQRAAIRRGVPALLAPALARLVVLLASLRLHANLFSADPIHWVGRIAPRPTLIMHGAQDQDVPVVEAQRLFQAAREPKELWIVPNAPHREIETVVPEEYRRRVVEFFERAFEGQKLEVRE